MNNPTLTEKPLGVLMDEIEKREDPYFSYHSRVETLDRLTRALRKAMAGLEKIANQDYRGNRPTECVIALNALKEIER